MSSETPEPKAAIPPGVRLVVYGVCFVICALAYLHILPTPVGILSAAAVPLLWAVDAYRRQNRGAFLLAAIVTFLALVPLLKFLR